MNTNDRIGHTPLILSDQVDLNRSVNMLVIFHKLQHEGYSEFTSENFSLVRSGSELKYPETVFANLEILFIVFLHIAVVNSPSSMSNMRNISHEQYGFVYLQVTLFHSKAAPTTLSTQQVDHRQLVG